MKGFCLLGSAFIIAFGLLGFGYFSKLQTMDTIEVKGLSEKVVRADVGHICITISNHCENLEKLYTKRAADKIKVVDFLKSCNVTDEEILDSSMDTKEYEEESTTISPTSVTKVEKIKFYKSEDKLSINTKDLGKIEKIKDGIMKLSSEEIFIGYNYSYDLTNFLDIKIQMLKEASENARKNAEAFIEPQGQKCGEVVYLRQGEITIRAENESETIDSWSSKEKTNINKKLRLVVRAGFAKEKAK
ncbi:MAG: SIMPL domain-containing protein [Holosporaceae bacterium]|jgi:hypothetical protein|nr:SIMPL domain-containing protein [Holosporaceae bacterium]